MGDLAWPEGVSMQERSVRSASMLPLRGPLLPELPSADVGLLPAGRSLNSTPCMCMHHMLEVKVSLTDQNVLQCRVNNVITRREHQHPASFNPETLLTGSRTGTQLVETSTTLPELSV